MQRALKKILVLSIWEDIWSLGEGSGVPDEIHFIDYLTSRGIEIDYLIPEPPGGVPTAARPGLTYHTYPNIFRSFMRYPAAARRFLLPALFPRTVARPLERLAGKTSPDLVLGYSYYSIYPLSVLRRKIDLPAVVKLFGVMYLDHLQLPMLKYWWFNYEQMLALRFEVDRYIVLNDGTRGKQALERRGIDPGKISFLPNGMNLEWAGLEVDRDRVRSRLGLPAGKTLIVTLSRLSRSKRVGLLLETAARIEPSLMEGAALVVCGDGPDREKLEELTRSLGLSDKVFFTGAIRYDDVPEIFKACDIFAGTNELTNMSMPACEAMLCALPVVAFDTCGTSEVVRDGETGLLAPDGDTAALAAQMERLLDDRDLAHRLGEGALSFALSNFMSWEDRIGREHEILEELVR